MLGFELFCKLGFLDQKAKSVVYRNLNILTCNGDHSGLLTVQIRFKAGSSTVSFDLYIVHKLQKCFIIHDKLPDIPTSTIKLLLNFQVPPSRTRQ